MDPLLPPEVCQASVVTMGMGNLLHEERLLLILGHPLKAQILSELYCRSPNAAKPFTALNFHRNVTIVATRDIAQASGILAGCNVVLAKDVDAFLTSECGTGND